MLPTGLTYSSLAKRFIPFIANRTCGVGRRVFRSSSKRVARRDAGKRRSTHTRGRSSTRRRVGERSTPSSTISRPIRRRSSAPSWRRIRLHYTPTHSSWLNQVELWFSKVEHDVIARGIFTSVADLRRKLLRYLKHYEPVSVLLR